MQPPRRPREPTYSTVRPGYVLCMNYACHGVIGSQDAQPHDRDVMVASPGTRPPVRPQEHGVIHTTQSMYDTTYHKIWAYICRTCCRVNTSLISTYMHIPTLMDTVSKVVRIALCEHGIGALRFHVLRWRMSTGAA